MRFDNRDVGLSTWFDQFEPPSIPAVRSGSAAAPYTLDDMAADTAALIDALELGPVHLAGISLGGYIAQLVAIDYPEKVLTSLMSGVGGEQMVFGPRPPEDPLGDPAEVRLRELRAMSGGTYFDAERVRGEVERSMRRAARIPVLVVHGEVDPMLPVENACRTASAVPERRCSSSPS